MPQLIEELEGGMGISTTEAGEDNAGAQNSSYACQDAFNTLKTVVQYWLTDTTVHGNSVADGQLSHFYRWMRSPASLLYDPALHRMIHKMMKKVWMQLLQRFRKLGSTIVYASFTKLIVATNKPTVARAIAYTKYVLDTIKMRPLFVDIDLEPSLMWETLMFLDLANFGGVTAPGQEGEDEGDEDEESNLIAN